ncbi:hypothetical protein A9Q83_00465 [Alphaproteobacteria bacterium 46_93_T64]|nr:hypothetical protein A9Q83_00465 [Alphaproteobacteria bacterium 46_93_T64]
MLNFLNNRSAKIGAIIALVFVFNIFSVLPSSMQHADEGGASHVMTVEAGELSKIPAKSMHEHIEVCGMMTCFITVENFHDVTFMLTTNKLQFAGLQEQMDGLSLNPPVEPPKV